MMPANLLRKPSAWALGLGFLLAMAGCEDRVAGSSVTTGNPTEIQVSFTGENGPVALTGRVEIYGATQIPVPGFRSEPLGRFDVDNKTSFTLNAGHFEGIADSLWAKGSLEGDSLARFNLVVTGSSVGGLVQDLIYHLKDDKFSLGKGDWSARDKSSASLSAGLKELVSFEANLDASVLALNRHHYLYIRGTGSYAEGVDGKFSFASLPSGSYTPLLVSLPTKEIQASAPLDSVSVYQLDKAIAPGSTSVSRGEVEGRVPVPTDLR